MEMTNRRDFVLKVLPLAGAAAALPRAALADVPVLTENDKMAMAMGFHLHTKDADQKKYPKHTEEQYCGRCLHFTEPGKDTARCDLFNKIVPKGGWCSGFSKRP
jgi:hypothetical protein